MLSGALKQTGLSLCILFFLLTLKPGTVNAEPVTLQEWLDLGWTYYNQNKIEEAFKTFLIAADRFPESPEVHVVLGKLYIEKGLIELGRNEILKSLKLDDSSPIAAQAHYEYAISIREEDPATALLHLNRSFSLASSIKMQLEISQQIRFCNLITRMNMRSQSGPVVLHFAEYLMKKSEGDKLAKEIEADLYLVETFCYFDLVKPFHIFLYPSERAVRAEIREPSDDHDPAHREFHLVYSPELDYFPILCKQIITDLQNSLNRHAGAPWVSEALPYAVRGYFHASIKNNDGSFSKIKLDCDIAAKALYENKLLVDIEYLRSQELGLYVSNEIIGVELGSLLRWIRTQYGKSELQQIITQPNIELILKIDNKELQKRWLNYILNTKSLISENANANKWAAGIPVSPLVSNRETPMEVLEKGLAMYLKGEEISGKREIYRALDMDEHLALGYYTLGWISCREGKWQEAERLLTTAVVYFYDQHENIAWCHAYLACIYIIEKKWEKALASLSIIEKNLDASDILAWASEFRAKLMHIVALQPSAPLARNASEFEKMRIFIAEWNKTANTSKGMDTMISPLMDDSRAEKLKSFYTDLRKEYPGIIFNHALQTVSVAGSALHVEVRIKASLPDTTRKLRPELEELTKGGYIRFFQVIPVDEKWQILDWEDGTFPISPSSLFPPTPVSLLKSELQTSLNLRR